MAKWRVSRELRQRARELRNAPTPAEEQLWQRLRRRQVKSCRFRRQHPIGVYIADFCCVERRLVVEVDGPVHRKQQARDRGGSAKRRWSPRASGCCVSPTRRSNGIWNAW